MSDLHNITQPRALVQRWRAAADEASREARHAPIGSFTRGHLLGQTLAFLQAAEDLERLIAKPAVHDMLAATLAELGTANRESDQCGLT